MGMALKLIGCLFMLSWAGDSVDCVAKKHECLAFCATGNSSVKSFSCSENAIICDCEGGFGYIQERVKR